MSQPRLAQAGMIFNLSGNSTHMAKMHTKRRGKAGSKKPHLAEVPSWVAYKADEIAALVVKLGKQGVGPSQIGLVLRDSYGIPDVEKITGKKLVKLLEEKGIKSELPEDLASLVKKAAQVKKHMATHRKDMHSKLGLQRTEAKIFRLMKYYKLAGRLPENWKYQ